MIEISTSILNMEQGKESETIFGLEKAKTDYIHIDVMDGKFVERDTQELMKDYALTISHISNLGLDVHFMVENVEEFIDEYAMLEPEIMTFHIETTKTEERTKNVIEEIKRAGSRVGISISPDTKLEEIKPYLGLVHMVLVMTVVPGKGGQKLIPETLEKVKELKGYIDENGIDIDIEVDGGINDQTASKAVEAGANILVAGNYLITAENVAEAVKICKPFGVDVNSGCRGADGNRDKNKVLAFVKNARNANKEIKE
jgi:ribulose-phosphate 3-epimerase